MRLEEHVTCTRDMRDTHKTFVVNPGKNRPVERYRRRCENNIKITLKEKGGKCVQD
jgi:hypothetical protein